MSGSLKRSGSSSTTAAASGVVGGPSLVGKRVRCRGYESVVTDVIAADRVYVRDASGFIAMEYTRDLQILGDVTPTLMSPTSPANLRASLKASMHPMITEEHIVGRITELVSEFTDVYSTVLSALRPKDLCSIQRVSKFWYELLRTQNELWKRAIQNEAEEGYWSTERTNLLKSEMARKSAAGPVKWKAFCFVFLKWRHCPKCGAIFRNIQCDSTPCKGHTGRFDLWEKTTPYKFWSCCRQQEENSPGCNTISKHTFEPME
ncbi:hypothetical protein Pelo_13236 [Pelomyxa schiedti]|nr:hypothetical protein Pelo_13236 [Pelomyxa schiedti]